MCEKPGFYNFYQCESQCCTPIGLRRLVLSVVCHDMHFDAFYIYIRSVRMLSWPLFELSVVKHTSKLLFISQVSALRPQLFLYDF
jgi:hypothetical protein